MPQIITADITSASYVVSTDNPDDFIYISEGVLVSCTSPANPAYSAIGVFHDNTSVAVAGTVMSGNTGAIYSLGLNNVVTVTATGRVLTMATLWCTLDFRASGAQVVNAGEIISQSCAVNSIVGDAVVFNTGLISGTMLGVGGATRIENLGTIRGSGTAVVMSGGDDRLINTGSLVGNIELGDGDDLFDTIGGQVTGQVIDGGGNDVYRTDSALLTIVEGLTGGTDRVEATVNFDLNTTAYVEDLTLLGSATSGEGNGLDNTLVGNLLANRLNGAGGGDTVLGLAGDDILRGGAGTDSVDGGNGDDTLRGDAATDRLYGGEDEDVLIGGSGRDFLYGGTEADTFQFRLVSDSKAGATLRDIIAQFETGIDLIDLTRIDANSAVTGNQAFVFIGAAAFGSVAGQLRLIAGPNSLLQGDVNGDGVADFELQLTALATISVNDLLL